MINIKNILLLIIFLIILYITYNICEGDNEEGMTNTSLPLSNEAIQNAGSILNNQNVTLTNLTLTGTLKIGNTTINPDGSIKIANMTIDKNGNINGAGIFWKTSGANWYLGPENDYLVARNTQGTDTRLVLYPNIFGDIGSGITTRGNLQTNGDLILGGSNPWIIHTPDTGNVIHISPLDGNGAIDTQQGAIFTKSPSIQRGQRAGDKGDIIGDFTVSSNADCANTCQALRIQDGSPVLRSLYRTTDKRCWCKNSSSVGLSADSSFITTSIQ